MPKYAIAFVNADDQLVHRLVELDTRDAALRFFFQNYASQGYTNDEEGFNYFKEDFFESESPAGSILEIS